MHYTYKTNPTYLYFQSPDSHTFHTVIAVIIEKLMWYYLFCKMLHMGYF